MQASSVIFDTKSLLAPIHASNYNYNGKKSHYSSVMTRQYKKSSVTLRPHRRGCSRPYLINPTAKRTLLMRHEAEIKSNAYWLGLMAHLQATSVPRKDISCIKDLTLLYESATAEDIYIAYEQLKIDENSLYSCIGIAGAQAGEEVIDTIEEEESEGLHSVIPVGRGSSTMTRPTT